MKKVRICYFLDQLVNNNLKSKTCHCNGNLDLNFLFNSLFDDKSKTICIEKSKLRQAELCRRNCMVTLLMKTKQNSSLFVELEETLFLNRLTHIISIEALKDLVYNLEGDKSSKDQVIVINCKFCDEAHKIPYRIIKNKLGNDTCKCECNIF